MTKNLRLVFVQFSFDSRLVLVHPSFVLRSAFVHPSLDNRRSIEEQSKIYRKNNENAMEPQGKSFRAATNMQRAWNEQPSNGALCAVRNVECGMLSVEWLPLAMLNFECWVLNCALCALGIVQLGIVSWEFLIQNSQFNIGKADNLTFNIQHSNQSLRKMSRV